MHRWAIAVDIVVVMAFVVIGREDHGFVSGIGDYMSVAAPFLVGLVITSAAMRSWERPINAGVGAVIGVGTVAIGMLLRKFVWGDGTALPFVLITFVFIVVGFVAWRLIASILVATMKRSARGDA